MKNIEEIMRAFEQCPDFKTLTQEELLKIAEFASRKDYGKCQEVFSFDHQGNYFYVVAEGQFRLHLRNTSTKEFGPGEIFGELAIFNEQNRTGAIKALTNGRLISVKNEILSNETLLPPNLRSKLIFILSRKMVSYLYENYEFISKELIERGECATVEFKESTAALHCEKIVETLCAFMNMEGGTIFIGVNDSGEIVGIHGNGIDAFRISINELIKKHLGGIPYRLVHFDIEKIQDKKVLRIDCQPADKPVFYRYEEYQKGKLVQKEKFLVRNDSANKNLKNISEAIRYFEKRFRCS